MGRFQIKNVKLKGVPEQRINDNILKPAGVIALVEYKYRGAIQTLTFQIEEDNDGSTIFYYPDWLVADSNLKRAIKTVLKWEEDYERSNELSTQAYVSYLKGMSDIDDSEELPF